MIHSLACEARILQQGRGGHSRKAASQRKAPQAEQSMQFGCRGPLIRSKAPSDVNVGLALFRQRWSGGPPVVEP